MTNIPDSVVSTIRNAARFGVNTGEINEGTSPYMRRCCHLHARTGTLILFTRDSGHANIGWFNPLYERCLHLSMSFFQAQPEQPNDRLMNPHTLAAFDTDIEPAPFNRSIALDWAKSILYPHVNISWNESAATPQARASGVQHWRVFCDPTWKAIKPSGEVYAHFAKAGWKSWDDINAERPEQ